MMIFLHSKRQLFAEFMKKTCVQLARENCGEAESVPKAGRWSMIAKPLLACC